MKKPLVFVLAMALALQSGALAFFSKNTDLPPEGAPIAQEIEVQTYRNIPYQGQFLAVDSQGDDITYTVTDAPKKGSVTTDGTIFVYTPDTDKSGTDRFTYTATDSHGNASAPATVLVTIDKEKSGVTYSDTSPVEGAAAQYLAEAGIFTGAKIGDTYHFDPDTTVSRSEFLAMVMEMTQTTIPDVTLTGFCDDQTVPTWAKGYVAAGLMEGFVQGTSTQDGMAFSGNTAISYDQAAAIVNRALGVNDVDLTLWYGESATTLTTWAAQEVGNLEAVSVMAVGSFGSDALSQPMNRGEVAQMLCAADRLCQKDQGGLFDWLL